MKVLFKKAGMFGILLFLIISIQSKILPSNGKQGVAELKVKKDKVNNIMMRALSGVLAKKALKEVLSKDAKKKLEQKDKERKLRQDPFALLARNELEKRKQKAMKIKK